MQAVVMFDDGQVAGHQRHMSTDKRQPIECARRVLVFA